jgi:hypothetical protein
MSLSRRITAVVLATAVFAAIAAEPGADRYELKDGGTLYVNPNGTMQMVDASGRPMTMNDGIEMALKDGRTLMMKSQRVWIEVGPPGKRTRVLRTD